MFKKSGSRKLKQQELDELADKIRTQYDHYMFTYYKTGDAKTGFEQRLSDTIYRKMNLEEFLKSEMDLVEELIRREEKKKQQKEVEEMEKEDYKRNSRSTSDILAAMNEKIAHYPAFYIHENAAVEVSRLFGALRILDEEYWSSINSYLRKAFPGRVSKVRSDLERRFFDFIPRAEGRLPVVLERYARLLNEENPDPNQVAREGQECLKKTAFFIGDTLRAVKEGESYDIPASEIQNALDFLDEILNNFRLKDLVKYN